MASYPIRALVGGAVAAALSIPIGAAWADPAVASRTPHPQTRTDLTNSMRGEAYANATYRLYADQARREGLPTVADVFDRAAGVELGEHFKNEAGLNGVVGDDAANLRAAIAGESYEARDMYPGFARKANAAGDTNAGTRFSEIARDEAKHRDAFSAALRVVQTRKGTVPEAPKVEPVQVRAGAAKVRSPQTKADLDTAIHGEALANAKYTVYGEHATAKGDPAVGRLFTAAAGVERQEHLAEEANLAGLVGTTRENLTKAIAGEKYESQTMYPTYAKRAKAAGDTEASTVFSHNAEDEAGHAREFEKALNGMRQGGQ